MNNIRNSWSIWIILIEIISKLKNYFQIHETISFTFSSIIPEINKKFYLINFDSFVLNNPNIINNNY